MLMCPVVFGNGRLCMAFRVCTQSNFEFRRKRKLQRRAQRQSGH